MERVCFEIKRYWKDFSTLCKEGPRRETNLILMRRATRKRRV